MDISGLLWAFLFVGSVYVARLSHTKPKARPYVQFLLVFAAFWLVIESLGSAMWPIFIRMAGAIGLLSLLSLHTRKGLARFFPINPHSLWHAFIVGFSWFILIASLADAYISPSPPFTLSLVDILLQEVTFIAIALLGAGLCIDRPLRLALYYLGFFRPSLRDVRRSVLATLAIYGLVAVFGAGIIAFQVYVLGRSIDAIISRPPTTVDALLGLLNPYSLLAIPAMVALGEELFFRGLLQPMLGLITTAFLFMVIHLPQNAFDPVSLTLLIPALVFGYLRRTTNTTTAVLAHFFYDAGLLTLAYFGGNTSEWLALLV